MKKALLFFVLTFGALLVQAQELSPVMVKTLLTNFGTLKVDGQSAVQALSSIKGKEFKNVTYNFEMGEAATPVESKIGAVLDWITQGRKGTMVLVSTAFENLDLHNPMHGPAVSWFLLDEKRASVLSSGLYFGTFGHFGEMAEVKTLALGPKDSGLVIEESGVNQGVDETRSEIFILAKNTLVPVLSYVAYSDNALAYGDERPQLLAENTTEVTLIPGTGVMYNDLELKTTGKMVIPMALYPEVVTPVNQTNKYRFIDGRYRVISISEAPVKSYFFPVALDLGTDYERDDRIYIFGWSKEGKLAWARVEPPKGKAKETPVIYFHIDDTRSGKKIVDRFYDIATLYNKGILDGGEETDGLELALDDSDFIKDLRANGIIQYPYAMAQLFPVILSLGNGEPLKATVKGSDVVLVSDKGPGIKVPGLSPTHKVSGLVYSPEQRWAAVIGLKTSKDYTSVSAFPVELSGLKP